MAENETMSADIPVAIFKKRGAKGKSNLRKRQATPPPAKDSDSDSDYSSSEDESGQRVKRRKKTAVVTASSKNTDNVGKEITASAYTADRNTGITSANDATKQSNWYDENAKDDLSAKNLLGSSKIATTGESAHPDGLYKGLANQTSFIQKNPDAPNKNVGPMKAPSNIRTITVTDFNPSVCKPYKQTGFCGYGDSCIYMHDRTAVQQGWQLDREWEKVHNGKQNLGGKVVASADRSRDRAGAAEEDEEKFLEKIPFVCIICEQAYKEPVVTKCGHYFCLGCALARYRKDPTCAACGTGTNGVFNSAKRLAKILEKKKDRAAKKQQEALEKGEDVNGAREAV